MKCFTSALCALGLIASLTSAQEVRGSAPKRPRSVVFYLMDTTRRDRLGFDGYGRATSPFLDRLAERSVVFATCYAQGDWTKPSMAALLTSQYPSTTGVYKMNHRLSDRFQTFPEVLRANGFHAAGFSANVVMGGLLSNYAQGFDHFVESTAINAGDPIRYASGSARKLNAAVLPWLARNEQWPVLLYLHSVDPHEEYEPEPAYLERFADPGRHERFRSEWRTLLASRPPIPGLYLTQDDFDRTNLDSRWFEAHASDLYDADIRANDDQLEVLWNALQQEGWGEDLILVFTSDHGEEFFDHGGTCHGYSLYEEMTRVPLLIYAPGLLPAGKRIDAPVRSIDIYPTLCELLGLEAPAGLEGRSLVPLIRGQETSAVDVFSEHREDPIVRRLGQGSGDMVALRSGRWKLIVNFLSSQRIQKPRLELYDLEADPRERRNVADEHPDVVTALEPRIQAWVDRQWRGQHAAESAEMAPEARAALQALGYVGGEDAEAPDLWAAIEGEDPEAVRRALAAGGNANQRHPLFGIHPLAWAALRGDARLARTLIEAGADVNGRNDDGSTVLSGAAFLGRTELLELLLDAGADPTRTSLAGDPVLEATRVPWDVTESIATLLGIAVEREAVLAGRRACAELLELILAGSSDPAARLFAAISAGDAGGVEAAIAAEIDLESRSRESGSTPLTLAAFLGRGDLVRRLLEAGARVDGRNADGSTALHGACVGGRAESLELLLERGASLEVTDERGSTPLHAAAFLGRAEAAARLVEAGAGTTLEDRQGRTPAELLGTDWSSTQAVIRLLGLELGRQEVEEGRARIAELLAR